MAENPIVLAGGCHCQAIRFQVTVTPPLQVLDCNCSICSMTGFLHLIVPQEAFKLLRGEAQLATYRFNTGVAKHHFCRVCGVKSFYVPRSHPDQIDINVRCLDAPPAFVTQAFDGKHWEDSVAAIKR